MDRNGPVFQEKYEVKTLEIENPPLVDVLVEAFGRQAQPFILDSAQSRYGLGEWSFFGAGPFEVLRGVDLAEVRRRLKGYPVAGHPWIPFCGGAVGYISYDYGRRLETLPDLAVDDREVSDLYFALYDGVAAWHQPTGRLFLTACGLSEAPDVTIDRMRTWLDHPVPGPDPGVSPGLGPWEWNMSEQAFCDAVERIREYIAQGDVYQVNLSHRARCSFEGDRLALFQALRQGNPAPYGAFIVADDLTFLSTSPEQFMRKRGSELETRPIKGTRPRGVDPHTDQINAATLRSSEKDRAELLMIVDLERNDFGRVAEYGSVRVEDLYQLEHYASVIHQTARVQAHLRPGCDLYDALGAAFPGGSITGAPKVRAMEIIEELEPTRRGVYCGSVGYIGFDGDAEFNIAIRSLHLKDGWLDYQVGSGIVWDSDPQREYQETLDKARAIRETLDVL
ncbi:MAG: aminodeoxychorismate synthase component I [Opitutales bacterium]